MSRQHYVLGFMLSESRRDVLLIRKTKPEGQAGKLNGVGGKVEPGEDSAAALVREFREEVGIDTAPHDWTLFALMQGYDFLVDCYFTVSDALYDATQETEEVPTIARVFGLAIYDQALPNIAMLLGAINDPDLDYPLILDYYGRGGEAA